MYLTSVRHFAFPHKLLLVHEMHASGQPIAMVLRVRVHAHESKDSVPHLGLDPSAGALRPALHVPGWRTQGHGHIATVHVHDTRHAGARPIHVHIFFLHIIVLDVPCSVRVERDSRGSEPCVLGVTLVLGPHPVSREQWARCALVPEL